MSQRPICPHCKARRWKPIARRWISLIPSATLVVLPRRLANFDGLYPWPGTDAGQLGSRYDPWLLACDPSEPGFTAPGCALAADLTPARFDQRRSLLEEVDRHFAGHAAVAISSRSTYRLPVATTRPRIICPADISTRKRPCLLRISKGIQAR